MSWYRTHRPQAIADLHLVTVREQLLRMLKSNAFPHAMLFSGPKGTGKTSSARIIAKVLNCESAEKKLGEPCNTCELCLNITKGISVNVVEIDAASNRRIDDVRELKERIYMPPVVGKKLVFIIDEVHMLTNEAFNALLKILEEPPAHAVFILATTDAHKLPDTVVSRCTIVQFQKASVTEISSALSGVAKKEKVEIEEPVIKVIAERADGSFRDAVKLFEEIADSQGKTKITLDVVEKIFPSLQQLSPTQLISAVLAKNERDVITFFQIARDRDVNGLRLHADLLTFLHDELLKSLHITSGDSIAPVAVLQFLLKQFSSVVVDERLPIPLLPLELSALEMVLRSKAKSGGGGREVGKTGGQEVGKSGSQEVRTAGSQVQGGMEIGKMGKPEYREMGELENDGKPQSGPFGMGALEKNQVISEALDSVEYSGFESSSMQISDVSNSPYKADSVVNASDSSGQWADGSLLQDKWEDLLKTVGINNLSIEALLRSSKFVQGDKGYVKIQVFYQFHKQQLELDRYQRVVQDCIRTLIGGDVKLEYVFDVQKMEVLGSEDSNISGAVSQEVSDLINLAEEALL